MSGPDDRAAMERRLLERAAARASAERIGPRKGDDPRDDRGAAPLSFAQQRVWFTEQLDPGTAVQHLALARRLRGPLRVEALRGALEQIVRRHEVLRTTFHEAGGAPRQEVSPPGPFALPVIAVDAGDAQALLQEEFRRPFDLSRDPPLRGVLLRHRPDDHTLLLTVHHIAFDGWSRGILIQELGALYRSAVRGEAPDLAPLTTQVADVAAWQRERHGPDGLTDSLAYWTDRLESLPPLLSLPADRPRAARRSGAGARHWLRLPGEIVAPLAALGRARRASLFMTLLAVFQILLRRFSGQDDVAVCVPVAGRRRAELEPLIGLFVNTLVLRVDLGRNPSFNDLLDQVRRVTLEAFDHQDLPFDVLVQALSPARSLSHTPLSPVMFGLQSFPRPRLELEDLEVSPAAPEILTSQFDVSLTLRQDGADLEGALDYATDLFDPATAARLAAGYRILLDGAVRSPDVGIDDLPMITAAERRRVLVGWNDTRAAYDLDRSLGQLVARQVERTPDATAVSFGETRLTYERLFDASCALARRLADRGVGRGSRVPVLMSRCLELVPALLGIMLSGAAYAPLDLRWPRRRLSQLLTRLAGGGEPVRVVGPGAEDLADLPGARLEVDLSARAASPEVAIRGEDPIYVIFTSGSTGQPKGVVVPHRGIVNRLLWMNEALGGRAGAAAALQTTRHVHDSSVWQLFWPLINGGEAVIPRDGTELDADYLTDLIERRRVSITDFVPSVFDVVTAQLMGDPSLRGRLRSLRTVIIGGEEIHRESALTFARLFPDIQLRNVYGPTEASIGCITHPVAGDEAGKIPIGRPLSNVAALILDRGQNPCPVGVPGELHVTGACLGLGYLDDAESTAAAFIENPLPEVPWPRLYRTGDLARFLPDGNIDFLGRIDHQVKIRGLRIEPGEIEATLRAHPGVSNAAVVVLEHEARGPVLGAYVALEQCGESAPPSPRDLREFCKERLPAYMVPDVAAILETLPLGPGGKLDRRALPAPDWTLALDPARDTCPPATDLERTVAAAWERVLQRDALDTHANFFDLGGHSLLLIQVQGELTSTLGSRIPIVTLFQHPTIAALARHLEADDGGADVAPAPRRQRRRDLAAMLKQQGLRRGHRQKKD